jgi:hypothetical protein
MKVSVDRSGPPAPPREIVLLNGDVLVPDDGLMRMNDVFYIIRVASVLTYIRKEAVAYMRYW